MSDIRSQKSEVRSQKSVRGHPGEIRCAVTASISLGREVGNQKSEVRNRSEVTPVKYAAL